MTRAVGITIAPLKRNFESSKDWEYYSLYFPAIEQKDTILNIIEKVNGTQNDFNFYGIQLVMEKGIEVIDWNE